MKRQMEASGCLSERKLRRSRAAMTSPSKSRSPWRYASPIRVSSSEPNARHARSLVMRSLKAGLASAAPIRCTAPPGSSRSKTGAPGPATRRRRSRTVYGTGSVPGIAEQKVDERDGSVKGLTAGLLGKILGRIVDAPEPRMDTEISTARRWAITLSVMMVTVMQVLDTSVTNVALPHMQGSLSAGIEEMSWVLTSYLAANAVVIPATGWLSARFGRRRFFLICTVLFAGSSFLSGIAPNLEFLVAMRVLQGLGGGPVIPMAQAIMWEIFPLRQRGTAMAVWGVGIMMAPILGPTVGGWIVDNWSWRWIFYINIPIGFMGFLMVSAFLFDSPFAKKSRGIDAVGLVLMVVGFGCLQLVLDLG